MDFHRNFGFSKVEWKIENYFTETCKKNWIIYSPEFSVKGSQPTKWRLCLKLRNIGGKFTVWVYLERSEHDCFPYTVQVNWRVLYPCGADNCVTAETTANFKRKSTFGMEIYDFQSLERNMHSLSWNTIIIRCLMMVYKKDSKPFGRSNDSGLKSLSQDMIVAYRLKRHSDMLLHIGSSPISIHKAVLSCRNKVLEAGIDNKNCRVDLSCLDWKATKNVLAYLYTGNLDYVLRTPSLMMQKCIKYLRIKELEDYYRYDEVTLCTNFGMREYVYKWIINDIISSSENCISSSILSIPGSNTAIRLHLYTEGLHENNKYMSISIEAVEVEWSERVLLEFAVEDTKGVHKYCQRKQWATKDSKNRVGIENFVSRDILENTNFVFFGMLCIVCCVRVPTGSQSQFVVRSKIQCSIPTRTENHYKLLSNQISNLLVTGKYSDFTIICGETRFRVHKFILSTRSHILNKILCRVENEETVCISDIEPNTLSLVLHYLYRGMLKECELSDILKTYAAAERFFILPLKYKCSSILQTRIEMSNVLQVMSLAQANKDFKLKVSTFKFIYKNLHTAVKEIDDSNLKLNEHLFKDFIRYLRNISNLNTIF